MKRPAPFDCFERVTLMWPNPAVLLALLLSASAPAAELQGFSFDYQITGDRSIAPFQVFDDGTSTFLQFRDPNKIPVIFVRDDKGSRLASTENQGSYLRIPALVQRLELVGDRKTAAVVSLRKPTAPPPTVLAQTAYLPESAKAKPTEPDNGSVQVHLEALRQSLDALSEQVKRTNAPVPAVPPAVTILPTTASGPASRSASAATSAPTVSPIASGSKLFTFEVQPGQRLSEAVRQFVASQKLELDWDTGGADFEIRYGFRVVGGTLEEVLFGVLSPFKLNAVTRRGNGVVAVSRVA